jgi:hypothetical protein
MDSAIILPIAESEFADIVPTCEIESFSVQGEEID